MKRFLKIVAYAVGVLLLLVVVGVAGLYAWTGLEIRRKVPLPTHAFAAPTDSASIARGEHVVRALGKCGDCHGPDLGGGMVVENAPIGRIYAPNLTPVVGGRIAGFSDEDFEHAIRHGLAPDGRRLVIMPSKEYQLLSDEDLGTIIAYVRSVPPVDRVGPPNKVGPLARALYAAGILPLFPGKGVVHGNSVVASVPIDTTVAYGAYVASFGCAGCHGETFGGGAIPGGPPEWPKPANLTPEGIGHYTFAGFQHALREGVRPDGTKLDPFMPVQATTLMTDVELAAVWKYLRTLPPRPFGSR
jgi:mono/diheme cytochrome c family protein